MPSVNHIRENLDKETTSGTFFSSSESMIRKDRHSNSSKTTDEIREMYLCKGLKANCSQRGESKNRAILPCFPSSVKCAHH